jgi:hypothetical protein
VVFARGGRFLSEDPVGWNAERLGQPTLGHAFGYAAGNPLLYTDPEGLDVGQAENLEREYKRNAVVQAWNSFTAGGDPASRPSIQSVYGDAWPGDSASELQAWCDSGKDPSACTKLKVGRGLSAGFTAGLGALAVVGAAEVVLPAIPAVASVGYHSTVGPVVGAVTASARAGWDMLRNGWQAVYSHAQELTDRIAPLLDAGGQLAPSSAGAGWGRNNGSGRINQYADEIARLEERNAAALAARTKAMTANGNGSSAATPQERIRQFVRKTIAPEFAEPFEYLIHGTTDKRVPEWRPAAGKQLFTTIDARTAELFASRTVSKEGGTPSGVVIGLPRSLMQYGVPLAEVDTPRVDKPGAGRVESWS